MRSLVFGVCSFAALACAAAEPVTLKFSHFLGPQSFFQRDVAEPFATRVEERTRGAMKVTVFNGSSPLGDVRKQASQILDGSVDIALGLRGAEGERFPGTSLIELPFLVQDSSSGSRALWQLYTGGVLADEYQQYKVLALFVHDPGLIHTKEKRVEKLGDLKGLRLRAPNNTVAEALKYVGASPVILQVNEVMPAVQRGEVDGIVTNWANPLPDFNAHMKKHADTKFYTSAFFVLMNRARYDGLPAELRAAIDDLSGDRWVAELGALWNKWAEPVRNGANAPGHEVVTPDAATMAAWREGLRPVSDKYVADLAAGKFPGARDAYRRLLEAGR